MAAMNDQSRNDRLASVREEFCRASENHLGRVNGRRPICFFYLDRQTYYGSQVTQPVLNFLLVSDYLF